MSYVLQKLSEVSYNEVDRIPSGFKHLDWAYGKSTKEDFYNNKITMIGFPRGMISIWAGEPGIGKSRVCMSIGLNICKYGMRTLYIINEDTAENLRRWAPAKLFEDNFYIASDCNDIKEQSDLIKRIDPDLVVVDSLNMVANIRSPEDIKEAMGYWKEATQQAQAHTILIAHMNKKGEIKGSTDAPYLADTTCLLRRLEVPKDIKNFKSDGYFVIEIGKNRYGPSGGKVCFRHTSAGVEYMSSDLK